MSARTQHWQRWDAAEETDELIYYAHAWDPIDVDVLVDALRVDGVVRSAWEARALLSESRAERAYYGFVDGDVIPTMCDADGCTETGDVVDEVIACSVVYLHETP